MISDSQKVAELVRAQPHVSNSMTRIEFSALLNNGRNDQPVLAEGIEPDREARLAPVLSVVSGRQLNDRDQFSIVLAKEWLTDCGWSQATTSPCSPACQRGG